MKCRLVLRFLAVLEAIMFTMNKRIWTPIIGEQLDAFRATDNTRELYAVAVKKSADIVGQIPRKTSAGCSIFLSRRGTIECTITGAR